MFSKGATDFDESFVEGLQCTSKAPLFLRGKLRSRFIIEIFLYLPRFSGHIKYLFEMLGFATRNSVRSNSLLLHHSYARVAAE